MWDLHAATTHLWGLQEMAFERAKAHRAADVLRTGCQGGRTLQTWLETAEKGQQRVK